MKGHNYQKVEDAEFDAEQMKKEFLTSRGWKHSSSYPGSLWLWSNEEFKGCTLQTAYSFESYKEQLEELS